MRWSRFEAIGFLHCFWYTVLEYAPNGVISTLSPEVLAESLDMELSLYQRAAEAMESVKLLDKKGDLLLVHDWIDFAGTYLRNSKFRRSPEKWEEVCALHGLSSDCLTTVVEQFTVPTNQPTNIKYKSAADKIRERQKGKI